MIKKILLSAAFPIVILMAIAGCGHSNNDVNNMSDTTNATPASLATTNMPTTTNTDLVNTNLSTNNSVMSTNNP